MNKQQTISVGNDVICEKEELVESRPVSNENKEVRYNYGLVINIDEEVVIIWNYQKEKPMAIVKERVRALNEEFRKESNIHS